MLQSRAARAATGCSVVSADAASATSSADRDAPDLERSRSALLALDHLLGRVGGASTSRRPPLGLAEAAEDVGRDDAPDRCSAGARRRPARARSRR